VAGGGALIQLYAYAKLIQWISSNRISLKQTFGDTFPFLNVIAIALAIKLVLQLVSAFPRFAEMAYQLRPITIAYLHLMLLGIITSSLLVWYKLTGFFTKAFKPIFLTFLFAFALMEVVLITSPWWPNVSLVYSPVTHLFCTAIVLCASCFGFAVIFRKERPTW
jgi:hypothetical protein